MLQSATRQYENIFIFFGLHVPEGRVYTDQTGQFITPSICREKYLLICYHFDSNFIHAKGMKHGTKEEHTEAYKRAHLTLKKRGMTPKLLKLDNE